MTKSRCSAASGDAPGGGSPRGAPSDASAERKELYARLIARLEALIVELPEADTSAEREERLRQFQALVEDLREQRDRSG